MGYEVKSTLTLYGEFDTTENFEIVSKAMAKESFEVENELSDLFKGVDHMRSEFYAITNYFDDEPVIKFTKLVPDFGFKLVMHGETEDGCGTIYIKNGESRSLVEKEPWFVKDEVVFLSLEDWEAMYLNGMLMEEGHHINRHEVFDILIKKQIDMSNIIYIDRYLDDDFDFEKEFGNFPSKLSDFVKVYGEL